MCSRRGFQDVLLEDQRAFKGGCHTLKPTTSRRTKTLHFRLFALVIRRFCQVGPRARQASNIADVVCN
jgi:hypothetical protein